MKKKIVKFVKNYLIASVLNVIKFHIVLKNAKNRIRIGISHNVKNKEHQLKNLVKKFQQNLIYKKIYNH